MADLLLELFSEEIPARMQAGAARDLERIVVGALSDRGLLFEAAKTFYGPRRLTLAVSGLPAKQPDVSEEKKGPRVNAPAKAIDGFLRSAGVTLEQCEKRDDGKGEFYVAVIARKGRATAEVLAEVLPECLAKLPWPKSMRWPQKTNAPMRWVRPLHSILCTLDGEIVPFSFAGVQTSNRTPGHRFLSSGFITASRFEDYAKKLRAAHVVLDAEERKAIIFEGVKSAAFVHGLEMISDEGLLDEVAGLNEWPVVLIGTIEDQFMDVPPEILQTSMRTHQKYFSLRTPSFEARPDGRAPQDDVQRQSRHPEVPPKAASKGDGGKFANRFAVVANMVAADGGKTIVAGNERVLRARLSDAKFFWDQDRKTPLADRVAALGGIVFHAKLGTQLERVERIEALAGEIAEKIGADVAKAKRAARLCKADLTTGVVGEFPELQGVMGRYYALGDNEDPEVADAIRDHYKPLGPSDAISTSSVSIAVALADKLDQLAGFFWIDERPTGSGDPFALRRAALGVFRSLWESEKHVELNGLIAEALRPFVSEQKLSELPKTNLAIFSFIVDRIGAALKERGLRHDLIAATLVLRHEGDIVRLVARTDALQAFLKSDDGANLLAGYKRAANILKAEEKKDATTFDGAVDAALLSEAQEKALAQALDKAKAAIAPALAKEDFAGAMTQMAALRAPVDAFFDKVKVNADDKAVRTNRLNLLGSLRATLHQVADFSKIEG